jgi:hypothetical protein
MTVSFNDFACVDFRTAEVLSCRREEETVTMGLDYGDAEPITTTFPLNRELVIGDMVGKKILTAKNVDIGPIPLMFVGEENNTAFVIADPELPKGSTRTMEIQPAIYSCRLEALRAIDLRIAEVMDSRWSTDSFYLRVKLGNLEESSGLFDAEESLDLSRKKLVVIANFRRECIHDYKVLPLAYSKEGKGIPFTLTSSVPSGAHCLFFKEHIETETLETP